MDNFWLALWSLMHSPLFLVLAAIAVMVGITQLYLNRISKEK